MISVQQIKPLTSIRAFAALWVVFMHLNGEFSSLCPALKHFNWIIGFGWSGVDLFFVLSGFILCYTHVTRNADISLNAYFQFVWLRIARVYPAYLVALATIIIFVLTARICGLPLTDAHYPAGVLVPELLMVQTWAGTNGHGWNAVDWSVSAEWFAYLFVFPIATLLLRWIKRAWLYSLLAALLLAGLSETLPWPHRHTLGIFVPPPIAMITLEFLAGAMLCGLKRQWNSLPARTLNAMLGLSIGAALFLMAWPSLAGDGCRPAMVGCFGLAILALSYERGIMSGFMSTPVLVYLGEISYSLYLTHQIVQRVLKVMFHPDRFDELATFPRLLFFVLYLVAILGAAAMLYHLVEQPSRRYLRKVSPFENRNHHRP
jgi:peptidoglycan/LPS O-acetylase OafA/YrhL